jgi:hypothetical protein
LGGLQLKYLLVIDEDAVYDKNTATPYIKVQLKPFEDIVAKLQVIPVQKPVLVAETGKSAYLDQGHIDAMASYEFECTKKEILERINEQFNSDDFMPGDKRPGPAEQALIKEEAIKNAVIGWNNGWQGIKEQYNDLEQRERECMENIRKAVEEAKNG